MKIHLGTQALEDVQKAVVTAGTFDGVHLGHQKILNKLSKEAERLGGETVLITYWPHPRLVLQPHDNDLQLLSTFPEKANLLEKFGINHLVKIPFTKEFSDLSPEDYVRIILHERIKTKKFIIGYDHRFGNNRQGGLETLNALSDTYDFELEEIPRQDVDAIGVSSTKIRTALLNKDIKKANTYLGRYYSLSGRIVEGQKIGRTLGFPTANLHIKEKYKLIPADGIYAVRVCHEYKKYDGMLNIGQRPTVGGQEKSIEVHIFNFDKDIYNTEISLELIDFIREEQKFNSLEALKTQLKTDQLVVKEKLEAFKKESYDQ